MEKTTKKKILKVTSGVVALGLVSVITIGSTLAYISANTTDKTNVFTSSEKIDIEQAEPNWSFETTGAPFKPGDDIEKDPNVEIQSGSANCYVAMKLDYYVEDPNGTVTLTGSTKKYRKITSTEFANIASLQFGGSDGINSDKWTKDSDNNTHDFYYYKDVVSTTEDNNGTYYDEEDTDTDVTTTTNMTQPIFSSVKFKNPIADDYKIGDRYADVRIVTTSYAVQADNIIDADAAKTELHKMAFGA